MRAYYSTHKHFRLFVLGVPEAWLIAIYDLHTNEWLDKGGCATLKEAKADAVKRLEALLGSYLTNVRWH